jgi:ribosomal protein L37AE/L43A
MQKHRAPRRYPDPHDRAAAEMCGLSFGRGVLVAVDEPTELAAAAEGDDDPAACAQCGSTAISWDPADGWSCSNCGASDNDE